MLGALSGSLIGPAFSAIFLRLADGSAEDARAHRRLLSVIAIGNALVLAGAVVMAASCMRHVRPCEIAVALMLPVPYALYRSVQPCVPQHPRF